MNASFRKTLMAAGSVMDVYPMGDYSEYLETGSYQDRLRRHWEQTGRHLINAVKNYEQAPQDARVDFSRPNGR